MTYNVAGLPEGISASRPARNIPRISPLLNSFDIVVAQEDFFYHEHLAAHARHPFVARPAPWSLPKIGDGLSCFSQWPFREVRHTPWAECHGTLSHANDCMAAKGFAWSHHELSPSVGVDVYNLHMDAGSSEGDGKARLAQLLQLEKAITSRSQGRAVIVGGDTNLRGDQEEAAYQDMLKRLRLEDVCHELSCQRPQSYDRVAYRSGGPLSLSATQWATPTIFTDEDGVGYSDHDAVAVEFAFHAVQPKAVAKRVAQNAPAR